jgi:hypothetical protein
MTMEDRRLFDAMQAAYNDVQRAATGAEWQLSVRLLLGVARAANPPEFGEMRLVPRR